MMFKCLVTEEEIEAINSVLRKLVVAYESRMGLESHRFIAEAPDLLKHLGALNDVLTYLTVKETQL